MSPENARVRVAHLSPDAPAVDFCIAAHGSDEWAGPVLGSAGGPLGLAFGQLTKYLDVEAMRYDVRLVAPAATDCSQGLVADFTDLPELPGGGSVTIAATGNLEHGGNAAFTLRAYIDDAAIEAGKTKLRFIHASPGTPAVDLGIGGGVLFTPVFEGITYGMAESITTAPATNLEISARPTEGHTGDVIAIKQVTLPADANLTTIAIGELGNAAAPLKVLVCNDSGPPHALLTECKLLGDTPERAMVRIAHLSPDAPAVDVCIAQTGTHAWGKPLLGSLGATDGLAYSKITTYVKLPIATYDARIVLAGAADCASPAVPDTVGIAVTPGIYATVAAIGVLDRSGTAAHDPGFQLETFVDASGVGDDKIKLRFVHASPGTPAVDVGLGTSTSWVKVFANVSFGNVATNSPMDAQGYIETNPFSSAVSARLANTHSDALIVPHVAPKSGSITTAFAIGGKTGAQTNPLRVLLCADNAPAAGLLTQCVTAP